MALYQPLTGPASFRLLRVHRDAYGALAVELKNFVLEARGTPRYLPVSYDWGDGSRQVTVSINGHRRRILQSAFEVLELVCDRPEYLYRPWIFLEPICVNQEDLDERATFVSQRKHVFGESKGALVWLGPATPESDDGMDMMALVAHSARHEDPRMKDMQSWLDYQDLMLRPWWRNARTLYECISPRVHQEIQYYCGTKHLSGREVLWAAAETPELLDQVECTGTLDRSAWEPLLLRRRLWQWYRGVDPGERISLLSGLIYNAGMRVEEDRDRVYAFLHCVRQAERQIAGTPKYDVSAETLYLDVARSWIVAHQSLDILSIAALFKSHQSEPRALPSWVPDWRAAENPEIAHRCRSAVPLMVSQSTCTQIGNLRSMDQLKVPMDAPMYAPAGETPPQIEIIESGRVLRVKGIVLDAIDGLTGMASGSLQKLDVPEPMVQPTSPINCLSDAELGISSSRAIDKRYGQIDIVADIIRDDVLVSLTVGRADDCLHYQADSRILAQELQRIVSPGEHVDKGADVFLTWLRLNAAFKVCSRPLSTLLGSKSNDNGDAQAPIPRPKQNAASNGSLMQRFNTTTAEDGWSMRLIVTQQGYVGMAPRYAKKGDLICVLLGCHVPIALRRVSGTTFEVVGECYMQGFMKGQALQDDHQLETFDLV